MSSRTRETVGWVSEWNDTFKGWAINYIRENKWRCINSHEFEDLIQDAYLTFRRVKAAYPRVTEPKHFMALYKRAMINEMTDRARYKQQQQSVETEVNEPTYKSLSDRIDGGEPNRGMLLTLFKELPPEARIALKALTDEDLLIRLREPPKRSRLAIILGFKPRENLNGKLCRILGIPRGTDLVGPLKSALTDGGD